MTTANKHLKTFRFKVKNKSDKYPHNVCCASRCEEPSAVIHAATKTEYPLCERHWELFCGEKE